MNKKYRYKIYSFSRLFLYKNKHFFSMEISWFLIYIYVSVY